MNLKHSRFLKGGICMERDKIKVIVCRVDERAEVIEIEDKLEAMQEVVGGLIQEYMPWEDEVAIICNEEGKMNRMPLNRAIIDEDGQMLDIIAGPFFICYAPLESETFESLPPDLEEKYRRKFEQPERFFKTEKGISSVKYEPDSRSTEIAQIR
jgi:hypothetical protein